LSAVSDRMVDTMASCIATFLDFIVDWKCMSYRHTARDIWRQEPRVYETHLSWTEFCR